MIDYGEKNTSGGSCWLEYGPTGSGKTHSAITLPSPILYIVKEDKDPRLIHKGIRQNDGMYLLPNGKLIRYVEPENFEDGQNFLNRLIAEANQNKLPYASVFHDGLTSGQASFRYELEDSRYNARVDDPHEKVRGIIDRFTIINKDWGGMGSMMARESKLLNKLSKFGLIVVTTAIDQEYPKWNQSVKVGPALQGLDFPKLVPGLYDFIGYVIKPFRIQNGEIKYPRISFINNDDGTGNGHMARCSSDALITAELKNGPPPLDWEKILKVIRG